MALDYWHRYGTDSVGVEMMIGFCRKYESVYVYGNLEGQQLLAKFLLTAGIHFKGFIISWEEKAKQQKQVMGFPVFWPGGVEQKEKAGVLIAIEEHSYNEIVPLLIAAQVTNLFFVNELNRFAIAQKMRPAPRDFFWFEINVVDHCNLNCQMCDHFSPVAKEHTISLNSLKRQISRMAELTGGEVRAVKLEGGEPLLHPKIHEIAAMVRHYFTKGHIYLYTNGLLMDQWEHGEVNLWKCLKEHGIELAVTEYPIRLDYQALREKAKAYGVAYCDVTSRDESGVKYSFHHPFDVSGSQEAYHFINCFCFNNCNALRDGRMYPCSVLPNVRWFNEYFQQNLQVTDRDSIDIFQAESFEEIADFLSDRVPFCRYCRVKDRKAAEWRVSKRDIREWT